MEIENKEIHKSSKPQKESVDAANELIKQIEFYLSNENLNKGDGFFQNLLERNSGFIKLNVFLKCNRVKEIMKKYNLNAISFCKLIEKNALKFKSLKFNAKTNMIARKTEFVFEHPEPTFVGNTVYIENIPDDNGIDEITKMFEECGKIIYVSLPTKRNSGLNKGFTFISFSKSESVEKALAKNQTITKQLLDNSSIKKPLKVYRYSEFSEFEKNFHKVR